MPAGTSAITAIANATISGSTTTTVTFSSITSAYRDILVVVSGTNSVDANLVFRFNSDSGSTYTRIGISGNGSTFSSSLSSLTGINFNNNARIGTTAANFALQVMDYVATDKHKPVLAISDRSDAAAERHMFRWANTAAITSISALVTGGNLVAGTTFTLYGISS